MSKREADPAEAMLAQLAARGGRRTTNRQVIIETIVASDPQHFTAEEIAARVRDRVPRLNISTVYRTLDALADVGIIEHVHLAHGPAVYHMNTDGHRHLYCEVCGSVEELPKAKTSSFFQLLDRDYGFQVDQGHFAIVGTCRACRG